MLLTIKENLSLDEDIQKWTVNDVYNFISGLPGCSDYAQVKQHLSIFLKVRHFEIYFLHNEFCRTWFWPQRAFLIISPFVWHWLPWNRSLWLVELGSCAHPSLRGGWESQCLALVSVPSRLLRCGILPELGGSEAKHPRRMRGIYYIPCSSI